MTMTTATPNTTRGTVTPAHLPGARPSLRYTMKRIRGLLAPPVRITPPPADVLAERDVAVPMRDGTLLRVNVFRPAAPGHYPVIMCAHPYRKDALPRRVPWGYLPLFQMRIFRHPVPMTFSAWTGWEGPDPAYWVKHGYVVVNCDLRGFGHSAGEGTLMSDQEAQDYAELIAWAGTAPWSNGKVGLNGVSYLALSQYKVAALRPPHLAAICPWEGFSDFYRDFARPGGVQENGFMRIWSAGVMRQGRTKDNVRAGQLAHPLRDDWWTARVPDLQAIRVPMLVCGSFSDHSLHSRGSFRAFTDAGSQHRWLYTHRGGKWCTYYSAEALAVQRRFFDHFLKNEPNGQDTLPPVRLEVRSDRDTVAAVRYEAAWPLPDTHWTELFLGADGQLHAEPAAAVGTCSFDLQHGRARFCWDIAQNLELSGPMALRLYVEAQDADDVSLFVGVHKLRGGRVVPFEGSYGWGYDHVTGGWLKASQRALDTALSTPWAPVHLDSRSELLSPGQIVAVEIPLGASATQFAAGEALVVEVAGRWWFPWNPLRGQFPATYAPSARGRCVLHLGGRHDARLLVPRIPPRAKNGG